MTWRGPESLRPLLVPLESVSPWPDNPRQGDVGAVAASLARFGQQKPIVVQRSTGWIVAGNHTWLAIPMAAELESTLEVGPGEEWTHVAVVFSDLSEDQARAYAIADNRTSELGTYDDAKLAEVLASLAAAGGLVGTGFDGDDVDELLASLTPFIPDDPGGRRDPEDGVEVRIEIATSRAFLEEVQGTLAEWQRRDGVEVTIA